jgi:hypothetical protein
VLFLFHIGNVTALHCNTAITSAVPVTLKEEKLFEIAFQLSYEASCPMQERRRAMNIRGKEDGELRYANGARWRRQSVAIRLTNVMELSPSRKAVSCATTQELPDI